MRQHDIRHYIKKPDEIEKMRVAGRLAADVLMMITPHVQPGITTDELNTLCHDYIVNVQDAIPAPLNYHGFPKSICTSVNHVVCHGIPGDKPLKNGDILNIDVTVKKDGYHGDTSKMFLVGDKVAVAGKRVTQVAHECLWLGIEMVKPGASLKAIGAAIQAHAKQYNMSSVREFCGHGIGSQFHEDGFNVLHYDAAMIPDTILAPGHTFTIEPMINFGKRHVKVLADNWTAVTKDRSLSAQWEHTLLVTDSGVEVLTLREEEKPHQVR